MKRRGFTLIELLHVVAIIAILAAILFPVFARVREQARKAQCASNLRQIGVSLNLYAQEHDGHFPKKNNDFNALYHYTKSLDVFFCPSDSAKDTAYSTKIPGPYKPPFEVYSSYVIKGGLTNDGRGDIVIGGERLVASHSDSEPHPSVFHGDSSNVLFLSGRVVSVPADGYEPVVKPKLLPEEVKSKQNLSSGPPMGPPRR